MQLISSTASPFVRKVRVTVLELGLSDQITEISVATSPVNTAEKAKEANPLGKIPSLVLDDGRVLYDSRVITRYLDSLARNALYPEARIWDLLTLEATADGILDAAVSMVYEARVRPEEKQFEGWIEAQWAKVIRGVNAINSGWMDVLNTPLTIGHIAVGCALGYLDFRHPARDWRTANPDLAAWYEDFAKRPAMVQTKPQ